MRLRDLDLRELLSFEPQGGVLRFAGRRALILDAVALGILRKELIETVGLSVARGVLTRFGYVHGWRSAEAMKSAFPWDDENEWRIAGGRLHMLQGLVVFDPVVTAGDNEGPYAEAIWRESYEAEQHLLHFGRSEDPVCWSLCGFASGWLSHVHGREIICFEDRCAGSGDVECHVVGKPREEWGEEATASMPYYAAECLESAAGKLIETLRRTEKALKKEKRELARAVGVVEDPSGMIVRSEAMRKVLELARRVAKVETTVLVTGESGVGKERIARLIHEESPRAQGPFMAINCGAVSETLLESELFGHTKGSFTGALHDRIGLFEAAGGGTLFLDEVGELTPTMQVKILRALQEREIRRVGENKSRPIDVRVLAATNRNLGAEVSAGRFREDLYYRLRVIELVIPPLRERKDDILALARASIVRTAKRLNRKAVGFTPAAAERLLAHPWPGNVRELENVIERAVVLCDDTLVDIDQLPSEILAATLPSLRPGAILPLEDVERQYILAVLEANGGNRTKTALDLKIGAATLYRKLKGYGLLVSASR